jgi:hypothetical protein
MVAVQTINQPRLAPVYPGAGAAPALHGTGGNPQLEKYDLEQIVTDRSNIMRHTQEWWDNTIVPIDRFRRMQADPQLPYLQIGDLTPTQYTHPLISDFINKGIPFLLSKGVSLNYTPEHNPTASNDDLALASRIVRSVWAHNERGGRNTIQRRAKLLGARGGYAVQYDMPAPEDADAISDGYPVVSFLYDIADVQWVRDSLLNVTRVINAKRRLVGELNPKLRGDHTDLNEIVDFYEHWDRVNYGCVINGTEVVKDLTPHGYIDRLGQPMLPWVIAFHDEEEFILGDDVISTSALTPLKTLIGHPPAEHLLEATKHLSFMLTLLRFCITKGVLPEKVVKGRFTYDRARLVYHMEEGNPGDGVEILDTAKNLPAVLQTIQFFQGLGEQSGLGSAMLSGMKQELSGTSAHEQTDLGRAPLDALRDTLERTLGEEAEMILAMVASSTEPSTAQRYQKKYSRPLPSLNPKTDANYTNGTPLPLSGLIAGQPNAQITWLDLEGCHTPTVSVNTSEDLPLEQSYQIGMTLLQSDKSPFDPAEVIEKYFHHDNAQSAIDRGLLARMFMNPQLPFADLRALKELCQQKEGEIDPNTLAQLRAQIQAAEQQAFITTVQQKLQAISQGQLPPSSNPQTTPSGPPQAQGAPPPQPPLPPGAPPPTPIAGAPPGAPAPIPFPQQPPPRGLYG